MEDDTKFVNQQISHVPSLSIFSSSELTDLDDDTESGYEVGLSLRASGSTEIKYLGDGAYREDETVPHNGNSVPVRTTKSENWDNKLTIFHS
jgi:hypothetical protein